MQAPGVRARTSIVIGLVAMVVAVIAAACDPALWNGEAYRPNDSYHGPCLGQGRACRHGAGLAPCCNQFYCKGGDSNAGGLCTSHGL